MGGGPRILDADCGTSNERHRQHLRAGACTGHDSVDLNVRPRGPMAEVRNAAGKKVQVVVTKTFNPIVPFIPDGTLTLQAPRKW